MAKQTINLSTANSGNGDGLRSGGVKINENFDELYTHKDSTENPHAVTKAQVGLGNCNNTSDANKPVSSATQAALDLKAPLASPALTGTPSAPTASGGTNTTQIATTAFVRAEVAALVEAAPGALDTLDELAAAMGNDANFATTITNALAGKEASQTAASQAEAEAGTETAVRKWSPLRIKQAIAALAASGGGSTLVRGSGQLLGSDVVAEAATSPPSLGFTFGSPSHVMGTITVTVNGTDTVIYFGNTDPVQTYWIDTTSITTDGDLAAAFAAQINLIYPGIASNGGAYSSISNAGTGISATLAATASFSDVISISGGGAGTDAIAEVGSVSEVTLIAQDGTKKVMPVRVFAYGAGVNVAVGFYLKVGAAYYQLTETIAWGEVYSEPFIGSHHAEWYGAGRASSSLVARMVGTPPLGGSLRVIAIAERY